MQDAFPIPNSINSERLLGSLRELGEIGALPTGGVSRLALSENDASGRRYVIGLMKEAGLQVRTDKIGNVIGRVDGTDPSLAPVMIGSHIDTVYGGGHFDGNLGVLAGVEIVNTILQSGWRPTRGIEVGFFTNEEGSRFSPDMLGSLVYVGDLSLDEALSQVDASGVSVAEELKTRSLAGPAPVPGPAPFAFLELHIEQGPVLDVERVDVGIVTAVQGISWRRLKINGVANHAGTAPMSMRTDAGFCAAQVIVKAREIGMKSAGKVVATVGFVSVAPNLVNVVPSSVEMTIDMRSQDDGCLARAVSEMEDFIEEKMTLEGCEYSLQEEVALKAHHFSSSIVDLLEGSARELGLSTMRMVSGAGHDAQVIGRIAPAGMIFVPSSNGISHNPAEHTDERDLVNGANLLLSGVTKLCQL